MLCCPPGAVLPVPRALSHRTDYVLEGSLVDRKVRPQVMRNAGRRFIWLEEGQSSTSPGVRSRADARDRPGAEQSSNALRPRYRLSSEGVGMPPGATPAALISGSARFKPALPWNLNRSRRPVKPCLWRLATVPPSGCRGFPSLCRASTGYACACRSAAVPLMLSLYRRYAVRLGVC